MAKKEVIVEDLEKGIIEEIINETRKALLDINEDLLASILNDFSYLPKKELLLKLKEYNIDFEPKEPDEDSIKFQKFFISIENKFFDAKYIVFVEKRDSYDFLKNIEIYELLINPDSQNKLIYSNTLFKFTSREERNNTFFKIKKQLKLFKINFL